MKHVKIFCNDKKTNDFYCQIVEIISNERYQSIVFDGAHYVNQPSKSYSMRHYGSFFYDVDVLNKRAVAFLEGTNVRINITW